ncbi:MAG TPA: tetratricopeptide repeat protein [Gemmataceae bacterium]|nr:tetratricopeptide repeat protein [Gemmataceae bacterium]
MSSSRIVLSVVVASAVLALGLGVGAVVWQRWPRPAASGSQGNIGLPDVPLTDADPAVAAAVNAAEEWVQREPRSATAWGGLGSVLLANDFAVEADVCLARAEQLEPTEPRWPYLRGWGLLTRDRDGAIAALRRAVERSDDNDPNGAVIRLRLADALLTVGANDEAGRLCNAVLSHNPSDVHAEFGAGMVAAALDRNDEAVAHLLRCTGKPTTHKKACAALAALYQQQKNSDAADKYARLAESGAKDVDWPDPYLAENAQLAVGRQNRFIEGEHLQQAGMLREAAAQFRDLVKDYPDDVRPYVKLGMTLDQLGDYAGAEPVLRAAVQRAPEESQAFYWLSVSLYHQAEALGKATDPAAVARYQEAADMARRATKLKADHAFAYLYLGLSLKALGKRDEAIEAMQKAVEFSPDSVDPHLHLGETLAESGRREDGRIELQRAADLAGPEDDRPRRALQKWHE